MQTNRIPCREILTPALKQVDELRPRQGLEMLLESIIYRVYLRIVGSQE